MLPILSQGKRSRWSRRFPLPGAPALAAAAQRPPRAVQAGPEGRAAPPRPQGPRQGKEGAQNTTGLPAGQSRYNPKLGVQRQGKSHHACLPSLTYVSPQRCDTGSLLQFGSFHKSKKRSFLSHSAHSSPEQAHSSFFFFLLHASHFPLLCDTKLLCSIRCPLQPRSLLLLRHLALIHSTCKPSGEGSQLQHPAEQGTAQTVWVQPASPGSHQVKPSAYMHEVPQFP